MKKILFSLMTFVLVAGMVGAGAFAYFSDTETSTGNTFTAGTLDLALSGGTPNGDSVTGTWSSPAGWAPGDKHTATLKFTNKGTVDALELHFKFGNLQHYDPDNDGSDLMDAIIVSGVWENINGNLTGNQAENLEDILVKWGANDDGILTLAEFAGLKADQYYFRTGPIILEAGNNWDYDWILEFTFDPDAGNEYQGDTCSFDFEITAVQGPNQRP